jgi:hypothetical protein
LTSDSGYGVVAWEYFGTPENLPTELAHVLQTQVPKLAQHGVALVLHWPSSELQNPAYWDFVHKTTNLGVPVYPWITLPETGNGSYETTGYFPNATNYDAWCGAARAMIWLWLQEGLPPTTLSVDLEMRKDVLLEFSRLSNAGDVSGMTQLLRDNQQRIGQAGFDVARQGYREFVDYAHDFGFRVEATTLLPMLDDFDDGDESLRQGFQIVLDQETAWDRVSFQAQRTIYKSYGVTSYFVYAYAQKARSLFGDRAGIGLGVTDGGISSTVATYDSANELRDDVAAALAAGIPTADLGVYSLNGIFKRSDPEAWFQAPTSGYVPVPDGATDLVSGLQQTLDRSF